jgi:hypothetical protein
MVKLYRHTHYIRFLFFLRSVEIAFKKRTLDQDTEKQKAGLIKPIPTAPSTNPKSLQKLYTPKDAALQCGCAISRGQ